MVEAETLFHYLKSTQTDQQINLLKLICLAGELTVDIDCRSTRSMHVYYILLLQLCIGYLCEALEDF
jgi:hypothetical protein